MSKDMIKKGFLERIPSFSLILIMTVLMVIGAALIPMLRIAYKPTPKQGDELNVSFNWPGASPRVIEQEITSKIEGMVSSVVGVEKTSSTSSYGSGNVVIKLKENANISAVRFEISSRKVTCGSRLSLFVGRRCRKRHETELQTSFVLYHQCGYGSGLYSELCGEKYQALPDTD